MCPVVLRSHAPCEEKLGGTGKGRKGIGQRWWGDGGRRERGKSHSAFLRSLSFSGFRPFSITAYLLPWVHVGLAFLSSLGLTEWSGDSKTRDLC